ncbi:MAG: threonylcarbamoyl-AMP synthase [Elusimicrobiota bacterium]|jgi:L-threonylcarbamoyladenylate synthase|nr:threonylcarbamoyl-AMP synthase [Elusimicrobiota bacterium]
MNPPETKVYRLSNLADRDRAEILRALKNAHTAVLPTDTVYGLVTSAGAKTALLRLNKIKNNPQSKPAQILCNMQQAARMAQINKNFIKLSALWPGALTLVAKSSAHGAMVLGGASTVGLRVPDDDFILGLMDELDSPFFASSANLHGQSVCESEEQVLKTFRGLAEIIVLNGDIKNQPSCVVDVSKAEPVIIRKGGLSEKAIKKLLK